jgi:hypothetical protein
MSTNLETPERMQAACCRSWEVAGGKKVLQASPRAMLTILNIVSAGEGEVVVDQGHASTSGRSET